MPARNGTGPMGYGPMTGRGFGPCGRGLAFRQGQAGFGRGFGRGYGFRHPYGPAYSYEPVELTKEEQRKILESELKEIELEKQEVEKRLKALK